MSLAKKLTLGKNKIIAGVCSGIALYIHQDVSIVRIAVLIAAAVTGFFPAIVLYLFAAYIIPEE